jgi:tetratricopeptide (TPR) repeat protein
MASMSAQIQLALRRRVIIADSCADTLSGAGFLDNNNFPIANQISISEALNRAYAHWNAGQAPHAEQLCRRVLQNLPQQPDALHLLGIMAHAYGKLDMSLDFLRRASRAPGVAPVYLSNFAEIARQKGLLAEAEEAAQRAVKQEPTLIAAWNNLGIILQESGKLDASLECLEKVAALQPDSAESHNNLGNTYKRIGNLERAEACYRRALELHPNYAEAYSNLAFLLSEHGRFEEAASAGRMAIDINPQLVDAYLNLAEVEVSCSRHEEALRWLSALQSFAPKHPAGLVARAQVLRKLGRDDAALDCAKEGVAVAPDNASAHNTLGQVLQALGRDEEALAAYERAASLPGVVAEEALIACALTLMERGDKEAALVAFERVLERFPDSTKAMTARIDAKKFMSGDTDITVMEAALSKQEKLTINDQMDLHFALGKAYLDIGNSEQAFAHLNQGNAIKRATFSFDVKATLAWFDRIVDTFTPELMARFTQAGAVSELPVFIVGMPRSGTTLVEQILASHPQVHGAGELSALRLAVDRRGSYPASVASMQAEDFAAIGHDYLAQVEKLLPQDASASTAIRLIDKMPANFFYAALIPLILSGARIIHSRRDPVDTCLSCYSKNFFGEQLFSYELDELGQFHRGYQALMARLGPLLPPDRFIEVDYEAVVDDLEGQARRLIDFIGLPWDEACLNFHETRRVVRTASVAQVRQPIYASSKGRWRKHAAQLQPLLNALQMEVSA